MKKVIEGQKSALSVNSFLLGMNSLLRVIVKPYLPEDRDSKIIVKASNVCLTRKRRRQRVPLLQKRQTKAMVNVLQTAA